MTHCAKCQFITILDTIGPLSDTFLFPLLFLHRLITPSLPHNTAIQFRPGSTSSTGSPPSSSTPTLSAAVSPSPPRSPASMRRRLQENLNSAGRLSTSLAIDILDSAAPPISLPRLPPQRCSSRASRELIVVVHSPSNKKKHKSYGLVLCFAVGVVVIVGFTLTVIALARKKGGFGEVPEGAKTTALGRIEAAHKLKKNCLIMI